jgi:hypothetical protein
MAEREGRTSLHPVGFFVYTPKLQRKVYIRHNLQSVVLGYHEEEPQRLHRTIGEIIY